MADDYIVNKLAERNAPLLKKLISRFKGTIKKSATVDSESIKYLKKLVNRFEKALDNAQGGVKISQIGNADDEREEKADSSQQSADSKSNRNKQPTQEDIEQGKKLVEFIKTVEQMQDKSIRSKRKHRIGLVSKEHAQFAETLLEGIGIDIDLDGYELWIDGTGTEHIEIRHGEQGKADSTMSDDALKEKIPWAVNYADSGTIMRKDNGDIKYSNRFQNSDGSRSPELKMYKKIDGETLCVSECVTDSKYRRIYITSAYIIKKDSSGQVLNMDENTSPQLTSKMVSDSTATDNSITEKSQKDNSFDENNSKNVSDERKSVKRSYEPGGESSKKITLGMSDAERTEILKNKEIVAPIYEGEADAKIVENQDSLNSQKTALIKSALIKIGEDMETFDRNISIDDINLEIYLSKNGLRESISKDANPIQMAKLLPILQDVIAKSIGIEIHSNRYFYDNYTLSFENLLGGYIDGKDFVPVRFGLKHGRGGENTLYVIIDQNKIETEVLKLAPPQKMSSSNPRSASIVSISQVIPFVNNKDVLRYLPDDMLSEEQKKAKWEAIAETIQYTNDKNDRKYREYIEKGNLQAAKEMVLTAAKASGFDTRAYHYTDESFTSFDLDKSRANMDIQGFYFSQSEDAESEYGSKRYDVFLKMDNPYVVDSAEKSRAIPFDRKKNNAGIVAREWIQEQGYDSVVRDAEYYEQEADEYIIFDNKNIKSADTITYDDNGNIIPISKRFDIGNKDIRYSKQRSYNPFEDIDDEGNKFVEGEDGGTRILFSMPDFDNPAYEYGHIPDEEPDILETYKAVVSSSTEADLRKRLADLTKAKVYARNEAKEAFGDIIEEYFEGLNVKFKGKARTEIEKMLWNALNSADEGARMGPALDIAEAIITNAVVTENYEITPELELAYAITGYLKTHFHDLTNF